LKPIEEPYNNQKELGTKFGSEISENNKRLEKQAKKLDVSQYVIADGNFDDEEARETDQQAWARFYKLLKRLI
jgi:hypothetical protein